MRTTRVLVGDLCLACSGRVIEIAGDEETILAWCECGWPEDAHEMEILAVARFG